MHNANVNQLRAAFIYSAVAVILASFLPTGFGSAFAEPVSPYVTVYYNNWQIATRKIERENIRLANERENLERYRLLLAQRIISRQQFEEQELLVRTLELNIDGLSAKAVEKGELYKVTKLRVENGLEVAVCPD